ncbi:MAG: septum site-determining protein MinC [Neisseriaceae bacterium]|nr:septum site-determining protein MinC [Neisseriaceae bacterium]
MPFLLDVHLLPDPWGLDIKEVVRCFAACHIKIIGVRHIEADYAAKVAQYDLAFSLLSKEKEPAAVLPKTEPQAAGQTQVQQEQVERLKNQVLQLKQQLQQAEQAHAQVQALQQEVQQLKEHRQPESEQPQPKQPVQRNLPTSSPTIIMDKPVRSGQQVYAEGGDVICTALVSQGAEIIADGNIHIYAPFRGRALAGASGDKNARIFIHSMQGQLVSIAGIYRVFDKELPASLHGKSVVVSLDGGKLNITALSGIS